MLAFGLGGKIGYHQNRIVDRTSVSGRTALPVLKLPA